MSRNRKTTKTGAKGAASKAITNAVLPPGVAMPRAASLTKRLRAWNRYREHYNPLVGLTLNVARQLVESYTLGEFADLMWTYAAPMMGIENSDPDLLALVERRTSALLEMDWQIRAPATQLQAGVRVPRRNYDKILAEEQSQCLSEAYESICNLYEAIEHLALATFRGFAHVEKICPHGNHVVLELVDQWNVVRDGVCGEWKYNPEALQTSFRALPDSYLMDSSAFLIREVRRPVNRIALLKFIRAGLSEKDWDAFIEIYGIPSGVVTMPPNVPEAERDTYMEAAQEVAEGGSGALPHGATYVANDSPRGVNPFAERLRYLSEKLILAGTGGLLTMLTAPTGLGSGVNDAHSDTFQMLARKEARQISEIFQRQFDQQILSRAFPGRPVLAYFTMCLNDETDTGSVVQDVATLWNAGLRVDPAQVEERTGYRVTVAPVVPPAGVPAMPGGFLANRAEGNRRDAETQREGRKPLKPFERDPDLPEFLRVANELLARGTAEDLQPLRDALAEVMQASDEEFPAALERLRQRLPEIGREVIQAGGADAALYETLAATLASGLAGDGDDEADTTDETV